MSSVLDEAPSAPPRSTPFLERLLPQSREELVVGSRRVRYPAATVAWAEGDPMQCATLTSGFARVFISSASGRQATIRYVHPGDLMGAPTEVDFPGSVQIVTNAVVQYLDIEQFRRLLYSRLDVALALAVELAARYVHAIKGANVLVFGTTVQKLAYDLLERGCREQLATGQMTVKASQQDLADSINSTREVVSRAIALLRARRLISNRVGVTTLLDPGHLNLVARHGIEAKRLI